jgi:hypothetical protein
MNPSQITGILRIFLPTIIGIASNYFGADTVNTIGGILAAFVAAGGWSAYANTTSNLAQTVASTKNDKGEPVVKLLVSSTAPEGLLKLASDTSVPEIVHAASVSPTAPPPKDPYVTSRRTS